MSIAMTAATRLAIAPRPLGLILAAALALLLPAAASAGTHLRFETVLGNVSVELYDTLRPVSVDNFLNYVDDGDYTNSIVHRSVPGFVIQGGGFYLIGNTLFSIPTDPAFQDIPGPSNLRGTLAMAENAQGATSQWFINLVDNPSLDANFTVFGEVTFGMDVVDAVAALPTFPFATPFGELPLRDYTAADFLASVPVTQDNFVVVHAIPEPSVALQLQVALPLLALLAHRRFSGAMAS
jgi:cyclophilin family peptidyl-prolyl cis-trans isomerase